MKTFLLTAILAMSFSSGVFAFETKDVECPAFAESNKREAKVVKEESVKESTKDASAIQD